MSSHRASIATGAEGDDDAEEVAGLRGGDGAGKGTTRTLVSSGWTSSGAIDDRGTRGAEVSVGMKSVAPYATKEKDGIKEKTKTQSKWNILKGLTKKKSAPAAMVTTTTTATGRPAATSVRRTDAPPSSSPTGDSPADAIVITPPSGIVISEAVVVRNDGAGIEMENSFVSEESYFCPDSVNIASPGSMTMTTSLDPNAVSNDPAMPDPSDAAAHPWSMLPPTPLFDGEDTFTHSRQIAEKTTIGDDRIPERRRQRTDEDGAEKFPRRGSVKIERSGSTEKESDKERWRHRAKQAEVRLRPDGRCVGSSTSSKENSDSTGEHVSLRSANGVIISTVDASLARAKVKGHPPGNDNATHSNPSKKRGKSAGSPAGVEDLRDSLTDSSNESFSMSESLEVDNSFLDDDEVNDVGCCALINGGGFFSVLDVVDRIDDAINGRLEDDEYSYDESYMDAYQESRHLDRRRKDNTLIVRQKNTRRHNHIEGNQSESIGHQRSRERQRRQSKRPSKQKHRSERSRRSRHSWSSPSRKDEEAISSPRAYKVSFNPSTIPLEGTNVLQSPK
jgi:hypothetical protein